MFGNLFDMENKFWRWVCQIPHMVALSFLWLVMCIPLITAVPATVSLYTAVVKNMRPDIKGLYCRYFSTFRTELKRGVLMSLLWLGIAGLYILGELMLGYLADGSDIWAVFTLVYPLGGLLSILVLIWAVALEARFVCGFWTVHQNALVLTFSCALKDLWILAVVILCVIACYILPALLSVLPAVVTILISVPIEKEFEKRMPEGEYDLA